MGMKKKETRRNGPMKYQMASHSCQAITLNCFYISFNGILMVDFQNIDY